MAGEWLAKDPTTAALVLGEVEAPDPYAVSKMRQALGERLALLDLSHAGQVMTVAWSPDSRSVLTAGDDGNVRLRDTTSERRMEVFEIHNGPVLSVAFRPNGDGLETGILTASSDGSARLWSPSDPYQPTLFKGHQDWVRSASFSPDGNRILTVSDDGSTYIWSAAGDQLAALPYIGAFAASFDPAHRRGRRVLLAADDGNARIWDPATRELSVFEHEGLMSAAWSPSGGRVATTADDGTARIWNTDGPRDPILLQYDAPLWSVDWSPDGGRVLTSSVNAAQVWRADRPARLQASRFQRLRSGERSIVGPPEREREDEPLLLEHDRTLVFARFSPTAAGCSPPA